MTPRNQGDRLPVPGCERVQRSTFYLLGCERCGHYIEPPKRFDAPDFARPVSEPMCCNECGEFLLLVEGWVAPQTTMWQARLGSTWHHVVYPEALPDRKGRQVWTDA